MLKRVLVFALVFYGLVGYFTLSSATPLPLDDLVAWWSFDDPENSFKDETGHFRDITVVRGDLLQVASGERGNALEFQKEGYDYPYFYTDSLKWPTGSFTIAGWLKPYTLNTDGLYWLAFVSKGGNDKLGSAENSFNFEFHNGEGHVRFGEEGWYNQYYTPNPMVEKGVFHFVAVTYNGSTLRFYKDGSLVGETYISAGIQAKYSPIYVGADFPGSDNYFYGVMDEVTLWQTALTSDQIATLYNYNGAPVPLPPALFLLGGGLLGAIGLRKGLIRH
ncbi:LamG domain-containing protein [Thermosulfurimonas sp. F29]|uniref:LamG domain-containing protein n=1 Tax=Thermosulfurimonas sp. F29 TaxID=2867247 RepID=UPI001C837AFC|nr:LamG domain-containing protein [Thermosulfurimonas sp. F29]MBX6422895.1 LamG domain-containing protein [Thermosulfurimonas sp. F29]